MNHTKPQILRADPHGEFYTAEACFITEWSNSPADPELSIARARVEPGVATQWHRLSRQVERYVILSGQGRVEVGDEPPEALAAGDVVIIPPMCRQRITNIGDEDLVFLAVCTPRFQIEDYETLEEGA